MCVAFTGTGLDPNIKTDDTYGFGYGASAYMVDAAITSNGGSRVVFKDGKYVFGLLEPEALEAINWMKDLCEKGYGFIKKGDWSVDARYTFYDKRYLFCIDNAWVGMYNTEGHVPFHVTESYSWIDFPYGPKGSPDAVTAIISEKDKFLCIPYNTDKEMIEAVVNFLLEPLGEDDPDSWKADYRRNYFFDDSSFEAFVRMKDGTTYDYGAHMGDNIRNNIITALNKSVQGSTTAYEAISAIREKVQVNIDEFING